MSKLYFSINDPNIKDLAKIIMLECKACLQAECFGIKDSKTFSQKNILEIIARCDVLVIIISKTKWASEFTPVLNNESSLSNQFRFEIVSALNLDMMIIPLLLDEAILPEKKILPGALKKLWNYKSYRLRSFLLQEDLQDVLEVIEEELSFKQYVEEQMSLSAQENFHRLANYDAKPEKPLDLKSLSAVELRKVIESEAIFLKKVRGIGDILAEKNALSALAIAYTRLGQTQKAIDFFIQELEIVKRLGKHEEQCALLASLGDAYAISGKLDQAQKYYEEQKFLAIQKGFSKYIGSSYNGLGFVFVKQKKIEEAIEHYLKALSSYEELKDHSKKLQLLVGIGLNYQKIGQLESATTFLLKALAVAKYIENRKEEAHILIDLAETYHKGGNIERLLPLLKQAEETLGTRDTKWSPPLKRRLDIIKTLLPPQ